MIPKPDSSEKGPLGIPTMLDRAVQAVYHMAIDPVVECQSDPNSYGFRKYRSTHDAITRLRTLLDKDNSPQWMLDADVAKCFDQISHAFLITRTPICDKDVLESWLKSGVMNGVELAPTEVGTPQGGIISPLLCNIALNGLEHAVKTSVGRSDYQKKLGSRPKVHTTRYADDFIITGVNEGLLTRQVRPAVEKFLDERNLKLKEAKTRIIHIEEGVDFLGFNLRRHPYRPELNKAPSRLDKDNQKGKTVLIIRPSKNNVERLVGKIRKIIVPARPIEYIIRDLNPILRGWAEYFRISYHSVEVMGKLGHYIWTKMWIWARKRHSKKNAEWIYKRYVNASTDRKWRFGASPEASIYDLSTVTHWKLTPMKQDINPYTEEGELYYEARRKDMGAAKFRSAVYRKYKYRCPECGDTLHGEEPVELHPSYYPRGPRRQVDAG
uniref:Reverse transcriptase domain-containing protein n=1 Tax=Nitella hyalina TaxID=181804 RepID=H9LR25_NITHY|nr:hypothetical protein NIHY_p01 [Nitella hyalina]AEH42861.1 hypothetical protein NhyaMp01 [Nitella hyalina]